ncbi:hypothetical protein FGE12_00050 [Aggregicoccus sp. 17bor-14]|uniref:hypothetical protein n=1 Tax=Myxococcaceae TaxID=31 RepID=UPI00129CC5B4|nr:MULTISPECIES: hypothetical protein [Myxococcaceae]MBF5040768.1 hypothetical protein [Simulacricoccus sp. 17bor-14]MRI86556.1 hypothetical protein [Aggregicoccus sp. 17bor-14]
MKRTTRVSALVGLLLSLGLVWAASAGVLWNANSPTVARDAKYADAERLVFYRLEPGTSLRIPLPTDAQALRIMTHLVLPPGETYAPENQYVYGVDLRLLGAGAQGQPLLARRLFTRTRQSKAQPVDGLWMQESAFTADPGVQLTDGRELPLTLPPGSGSSTLELRYPGTRGALLVRVYARGQAAMPLSISGKARAVARAETRAERVTFEPWAKLTPTTQRALTEAQWLRVGADGEEGQDYRTEPVYRTAFRLPLLEVAESAQERLDAHRAVAVNVKGPTRLLVRLWSVSPQATAPVPDAVELSTLGADGHAQARKLAAPAAGDLSTTEVELPEGIHTLTLANGAAGDLRYAIEGPREAWLAPEPLKGAVGAAAAGARIAYLPDTRRVESYVAGPGCQAYELAVEADGDAAARLLRLDARSLGAGPSSVTLTMLDARGRSLSEARMDVGAEGAELEQVNLPPLAQGLLPCEQGVGGSEEAQGMRVAEQAARVSRPASARLVLPTGTRRVRIQASHPTALNLYSFLQAKEGPSASAPYSDETLVDVRWRHAPLEERSWYPLRPFNHRALAAQGAEVQLVSQVGLEPIVPEPTHVTSGVPLTLAPEGAPPTQELLEPVDPDARGQDAAKAAFTLLSPERGAVRAHFDSRVPTRPELQLRLEDAAALGSEVEVLLDGAPLHRAVLHATRSRELLPPIPPGVHEVLLRSSAQGLSALLNRPPAGGEGEGGLRTRTVYRLADGGLRIPVVKRGRGAVTLNMVLYTQSRAASSAPRLRVSLDGGAPRRRTGQLLPRLTRAQRELALPASDKPAAFPRGQPEVHWHARTVPVTLGEDLAPGVHWVSLKAQGLGPAWARFFVYGEDALDEVPQQWNRGGWEPEEGP